jgi:hypothetical protein
MASLSNVSLENLVEKYYLILNNRIQVSTLEIRELQIELRSRNLNTLSKEKYFEIFVGCLDVGLIAGYVREAFSK